MDENLLNEVLVAREKMKACALSHTAEFKDCEQRFVAMSNISDITGLPSTLDEAYLCAPKVKEELDAILVLFASQEGLIIQNPSEAELSAYSIPSVLLVPIKDRARAEMKMKINLDGPVQLPGDIVRCSVLCRDVEQIRSAYSLLRERFLVVKVQNRLLNPTLTGFRDIQMNFALALVPNIGTCSTFIFEVQFVLQELKALARTLGLHKLYVQIRQLQDVKAFQKVLEEREHTMADKSTKHVC